MSDVNYYGGNPLNRLSYLRPSGAFLKSALASPKARFVIYHNLNPLCAPPTASGDIKLHSLVWTDVKEYIGDSATVFKFVDDKDASVEAGAVEEKTRSIDQAALVFLGVDERSAPESAKSLPLSKPTAESSLESHSPHGIPYWALDATKLDTLRAKVLGVQGAEFVDMRSQMSAIPGEEAAIAGEGRALLDWNNRNVYCPACARRTRSVWAGWKRACIDDKASPCASKKGVQNYNYPRTDPVVIMAILDPTREKVLLGRQHKWPKLFYSALAGFIEAGESIEEAVRREVYEEAGIVVEEVYYHSSQPWPYPNSLMIGCIGVAKANQTVRCDLDNELEDAHYFSRASVLAILDGKGPNYLTRSEVAQIDGKEGAAAPTDKSSGASSAKENELEFFRLPPKTAIAFKLVEAWARGDPVFGASVDKA